MGSENQQLIGGWSFRQCDEGQGWQSVYLPHSPFVADLDGNNHWRGVCEYRRSLQVEQPESTGRHVLYFGAAMHTAIVKMDGVVAGRHEGGYLPFEIDVTKWLSDGEEHELFVELDNSDNSNIPPGKPLDELDFCWYGGLYRNVELRYYPSLSITDPVAAGEVAGGGVFVRTRSANQEEAVLDLRIHIVNTGKLDRIFTLEYKVRDSDFRIVSEGAAEGQSLGSNGSTHVESELKVNNPLLWSPQNPSMHMLEVSILDEKGDVVDRRTERFGICHLVVSRSEGIVINGTRIRPNGVNRHQDYPRVGYAMSDAAQYRDAKLIKESGFDYVRLSHYPQSPAFLDACDELGILVMTCIPGWQFLGEDTFQEACYQNARDLVRRDRNHPSVIFWELSLNETEMSQEFMDTMQAIGHSEYPGDQMFVCGWIDTFDVYIHSRQHGKIHSWENGNKPLVIAEYGDWEFYAANEGFDQKTGAGLLADWSNSRAFRGAGERRMRQQARNHIAALSDTLASPAVCDGLWSMFDYARGYSPVRAACGAMDLFRLPKYSYFFYRSQRDPIESSIDWSAGPMVYVASRWSERSHLNILVLSNCERVELFLNEKLIGESHPSRTSVNQHLSYPPFVFEIEQFNSGSLEAVGYIGNKEVAKHSVATATDPVTVELRISDEGVQGELEQVDVLLAHARVCDKNGQLCNYSSMDVTFSIEGAAEIVGPRVASAESGIASVVIRRLPNCSVFAVKAECNGFSTTMEYCVVTM